MNSIDSVCVPVGQGKEIRAHLALPKATGPVPGVVVVHDVYGWTSDVERRCRLFAEAGYAALGPALYDGAAVRAGCVVSTLLSSYTGRGQAFARLDACRTFLAAHAQVDEHKLGIIGFCMGGGFALLHAAGGGYAVCAPFYGAVPQKASRLQGLCPTIASVGGRDAMFLSHARRLEKHLGELGIEHEVHVYDEAGHSFMNDHPKIRKPGLSAGWPMRVRYDPETEERAWQRVLEFFGRQL